MAERPIIFSGPLVRAILAGEKTQTRRVIKPEWWRCLDPEDADDRAQALTMCPYGKPGDVLWVRECFMADHIAYSHGPLPKAWPNDLPRDDVYYRADGECCDQIPECQCRDRASSRTPWRPSIHMPRWACRLFLRVTNVRVERLQAISEEDIIAEGVTPDSAGSICCGHFVGDPNLEPECCGMPDHDYLGAWMDLWDSINGKRPGASWDANPWVWVVEFERMEEVTHG